MKTLLSALTILVSCNVFASSGSISAADVIKSAKSDSIARAAFKQAEGCEVQVTKMPKVQYDLFQINLKCTQEADEYTGGGVYLNIKINGQYWSNDAADVQKVEIQRAG